MNWNKLDKKSLKKLKQVDLYVLVACPGSSEYPYDIISFLDLRDLGYTKKEMQSHWHSYLHVNMSTYDYDDEILLATFSHYIIIKGPF